MARVRQSPVLLRAFSLIELVMVVMIIGIIAAIAVPRMSRGADRAAINATARDVNILDKAAEMYAAEHWGRYPNAAEVVLQLTLYTDESGAWSASRTRRYYLGPYLQAIPPVPMGWQKGATGVAQAPAPGVGWLYNPRRGKFRLAMSAGDAPELGDEVVPAEAAAAEAVVAEDP